MACSGMHGILQLHNEYHADQPQYQKVTDMLDKLLQLRSEWFEEATRATGTGGL